MFSCIVCHYGELSLKGGNRRFFEQKLAKNIRLQLEKNFPESFESISKPYGRIIINLTPKGSSQPEKLEKIFKNIFGIANFSFALELESEISLIQNKLWEIVRDKEFKTFRITAQRSDKNFPLSSQQLNEKIGALIWKKSKKKVSLNDPDLNCFIEITGKNSYLYFKKFKGAGGMPVETSAKSIILLSGGIDSPVAAYFALKRGSIPVYVHFHSMPFTSQKSIDKVMELAKILTKYNLKAKIYLIPFADIQKEIMLKTAPKPRVILYRRMMLRIAEKIAQKEKAFALYTGDSLAQVASQTLENINATQEAVKIPALRPLIGWDKEEIMDLARRIGTYETSILPHDDCCTRFVPKHPELQAEIKKIKEEEKKLNINKLIKSAIKKSAIEII
jgi:tRNA uracil 4-sulfurtransferase